MNNTIENVIVDLSHWNGNVNFTLAKEDGILCVIHKATQGLNYVDPKYLERQKAAQRIGLMWGAYHFGTSANGKDQADHFLNTISAGVLHVLDVERNSQEKDIITPQNAEDFVHRIVEKTGKLPVIYGSPSFLAGFGNKETLTKCPLWISSWGSEVILPAGWTDWVLWQYTNGVQGLEPHTVNGIGSCDRTKFNGTLDALKKFWS